ncbi:ferric-chelate reductase 1-like [Hydractinia symbiolongicarpus]|uniref:ferric-chelate reductase 1-like n=1 Tax=Hydractinia symbiolongicarpus TaxID=13093 RepID=UPI002550DF81|nr:ferric-chelate reductase 1-like [Hydractinia symbiolongicarpus]
MEVIILTFILSLCGLQASAQIDLSKCGNTLGCIRLPPSCSASACDAIVTHQLDNGTLTFQFATKHNWIGFGQKSATDGRGMAKLRGQYCARGISVPFGSFNASGNREPNWMEVVDGVVLINRTEKDDVLTCTFTRPLVPSNLSKEALYNLNVSDMVGFLAYGNNNGRADYPNKHLKTSVTNGAVDFLSTDSPTTAATTTPVAMTTPMTNATMSTTPRITPMTEMITIDLSECGNTRGCIRHPPSCSASACDAIITYRHYNGTLTFQFATKHNWIGFGQKSATDGRGMAKLRGQYCARGISVPFGSFNASGNREPNWMEVVDGVVLINRTEKDDVLTCTFTRPLVPSNLSKEALYNLNVSDMVGFIAYGNNNGRDDYPNKHFATSVTDGAVDFLSTATATTPTTPVVMTTSTREMSTIDLSKCGKTLGCVRLPENCLVSGCIAIVTYQLNNDVLTFQFATKHKWIGFAQKSGGGEGMADLRGQYCADGISVPFGSYVASGNGVPDWRNVVDGVSLIDRRVKDGLLICSFTRPLVPSNLNSGSLYNLNMSNMFGFLAYGNRIGPSYPRKHDSTSITEEAINFLISNNVGSAVGRNANSTVKLHAILMILAWVLFATIGIFMAHFMKPATQNKKIAGKQAWFPFHVLLMFLCVVSFIAGLIIILTKYNKIDKENKHHMLGLFTVIAGLIQPVMAFFRPGPDHDRRFIFNWAHRLVGILAWCLGAAAIIYGFEFFKEGNPKIEEGVMIAFVSSVVSIFIVLNLILLLVRRDGNDSVSYGKRSGVVEISKPQQQQGRSHAVEWIFLLIIIVLSVAMAAYHVYRVVDLREARS